MLLWSSLDAPTGACFSEEILEEDLFLPVMNIEGQLREAGGRRCILIGPRLFEPPYPMAVVIVALSDFTEESGATEVVPGSHKLGEIPKDSGKQAVSGGAFARLRRYRLCSRGVFGIRER